MNRHACRRRNLTLLFLHRIGSAVTIINSFAQYTHACSEGGILNLDPRVEIVRGVESATDKRGVAHITLLEIGSNEGIYVHKSNEGIYVPDSKRSRCSDCLIMQEIGSNQGPHLQLDKLKLIAWYRCNDNLARQLTTTTAAGA